MNKQLVDLAIQEAPKVITLLKDVFTKSTGEVATDDQVISAYRQAFASSLALDEAWLAAHPEDAPVIVEPPAPVVDTPPSEA